MDYRREIDGLRAVAVLPVILFHAGFGAFAGGFVGVDVFFVLSGYLITSIILDERARGAFSILRFYERRARRILPALFLVMAVCIPFAWVWMLPPMFEDFARSLGLAALSLSNFWFARETGYFTPSAELQPLLHTWSLAVEEQYYLIFPALLLLTWRLWRGGAVWMVAALTLASLALAQWGQGFDAARNFYFSPSRFWELGVGSLCAFALAGRGPWADDRFALPGLGLILAAILAFDAETPTPGVWTLVPVLGTALIVLAGGAGSRTARLLSWAPLVGIGLISYSAYLWHQPIFAFARLAGLGGHGTWVMLGLAVLALGLAWATWAWVEQPFRRRPRPWLAARGRLFGAAGAGVAAAVAVGVLADNTAWWDRRLTPEQRQLLAYQTYARTPAFDAANRHPDCFFTEDAGGLAAFRPDLCLALDAARPNVLLIGDSHAAHFWHGLTQVLPQVNWLQATTAGCRPLDPAQGEPDCVAMMTLVWAEFLPANAARIDTILLAGRWRSGDVAQLRPTLDRLARHGVRVVVLGSVAEFAPEVPVVLSRLTDGAAAEVALAGFLNHPRLAVTARIADQARAAGVPYVDVLAAQCGADLAACPAYAAPGVPMIWDYGHFTAEGSVAIIRRLVERDPVLAALAADWRAAR